MRAVVVRELIVIARKPAFTLVVCARLGLIAVFVLVWHRGVPVLAGGNLYEQQRLVDWWLLAVLLPWAAARCLAPDRGERFVVACALTALRPSSIVVAKIVAVAGALAMIVLTGFPATIVAQQISAVPLSHAFHDLMAPAGLAVLVSAATVAWVLLVRDRLAAWAGSTGSIGLVLVLSARWPLGTPFSGLALALCGAAIAGALASWSDGSLRYADE